MISRTKRRMLGREIILQTSIGGLKQMAITALETSEVFNIDERTIIANDIIDDAIKNVTLSFF